MTLQQPLSIPTCQIYSSVAWKSYCGIQVQERQYRNKVLQEKVKELPAKGNGNVAQAAWQIRHREKSRHDYASIRRGYGIHKQGLATLDTPDNITGVWKVITRADEIHDYL